MVLSLQLPFAIVPLVMFTADKRKMGALRGAALDDGARRASIAVTVIVLNIKLLWDFARRALDSAEPLSLTLPHQGGRISSHLPLFARNPRP